MGSWCSRVKFPTRSSCPVTFVTPRSATTTCRAWSWPPTSRGTCNARGAATRTVSFLFPGLSARSPGSRATKPSCRGYSTASCSPVSGTRGTCITNGAAVAHVLRQTGQPTGVMDFTPYGYDERQYCSPGYDLAVGCLSRTPYARYPEYHTSADNLDFVRPDALADSYEACLAVFAVLEGNETYVNQSPKGEPQLGRRGLYGTIGGQSETRVNELALLWVLNLSDGCHSLLEIAERAALPFAEIRDSANALVAHGLLMPGAEKTRR